jgi:hypothetical protein
MVEEDFFGEECKNGIIKAHELHRLRLPEGDSLSFYDYFPLNDRLRQGFKTIRYFSNSSMKKILSDMKKNTEQCRFKSKRRAVL